MQQLVGLAHTRHYVTSVSRPRRDREGRDTPPFFPAPLLSHPSRILRASYAHSTRIPRDRLKNAIKWRQWRRLDETKRWLWRRLSRRMGLDWSEQYALDCLSWKVWQQTTVMFWSCFVAVQTRTCTLREAIIIGSLISKTSIPVLHSSAAMLKIAEMDYSGNCSSPLYFVSYYK